MKEHVRPVVRSVLWIVMLAAGFGVGSAGVSGRQGQGMKQTWMRQPAHAAVSSDRLAVARHLPRVRPAYVPGRVVVKFEPGARLRAVRALAREIGSHRIRRPAWGDFHYLEIPPDQDPAAAAARLRDEDGIVYAEPDPVVHPLWTPNDRQYSYQWNLKRIGMEAAWDINQGGSTKLTVAVLDTGVAYLSQGAFTQAPDLAGTRFVSPYDFIWEDDQPVDTDGHGTHVTGTIAQATNNDLGVAGMAFNVNVMPVKVLDTQWDEDNGAPNFASMSVVARGIRYAVDNGAKVLNMSLGADNPSSTLEDALRYAVGRGAFVAVASGNSGDEGNAPDWPASYAKSIEGVMAVAAVDYNFTRAPYSTHLDYVEIAAPGGNLDEDENDDTYADGILQQTFDPDFQEQGIFTRFAYMFYQGTSMSTAHVSALAALLMDQGVTSPRAVEAALKRFASHKPAAGRNDDVGYGVIDPRATLFGLGLAK